MPRAPGLRAEGLRRVSPSGCSARSASDSNDRGGIFLRGRVFAPTRSPHGRQEEHHAHDKFRKTFG